MPCALMRGAGLSIPRAVLTDNRVERRLTAILAADVAGYSRLMGADEEGVLARLKTARKSLFDPTIAAHRGRIVKTTGDGMLVEFASAVDAARCAIEVQRGMVDQNATVPPAQRIEFRIGIHVGDIIVDDNDIFGDGVNIAARLEGIAEPGSVCISDDCAYRKSRPTILMVQSAQDRAADDIPGPLDAARDRGILVQRQMSARGVVVIFVRQQNVAQMAFAKDYNMIDAFPPD